MKERIVSRSVSNSALVFLALVVASLVISCGPDRVVGYQGRLTDASGAPINGNKSVRFRLYTSSVGGTSIFTETQTVAVTNGLFNAAMGSTIANNQYGLEGIDPEIFAQPLFMELTIDGEILTPRQKLLGAPYAMSLASGAIVGGMHEGNGAGGSDTTDINYGSLTVAGGSTGTALVIGGNGSDLIRGCSGLVSGRVCGDLEFRVQSNGQVTADGSFTGGGADFAEMLQIEPAQIYSPGDVLAISKETDRAIVLANAPYSQAVVGVYSTKPGFVGRDVTEETAADGSRIPVALVGIVPVKVSAENGPIHRGDLLTTSATRGHAMKATEVRVGTILGKAMGELESGTGVIQVLLTLQ
jgi:hypothetical protein